MIVSASRSSNRSNSRWIKACVLMCAMVVLPLGLAAQDYGAVEKRLGRAVAEGELSLKQAQIMLDALKGAAKKDRDGDGDIEHKFEEWIESVGEKLKAAVKAGKLSEKDAWAKWRHFKEEKLAPKLKASVKAGKMSKEKGWEIWRGVEHAEAGEKLKAAVAAGKLTEEQAWAKWKAITKGRKTRAGKHDGDIERQFGQWIESVGEKLKAAVKARKLSEKDAWAKWNHFKMKELAPKLKATVQAGKMSEEKVRAIWRGVELAEAGEKLKAAVAAGKITEEQARRKWEEISRKGKSGDEHHRGRHDKDRREHDKRRGRRDGGHRARVPEHLMKLRKELGAAVKAGKISKEDAIRKFKAAEKKIGERKSAEHRDRKPAGRKLSPKDWPNIKKRIEGAVKRGDMTRKQANAKYKEIEKRMGEHRKR